MPPTRHKGQLRRQSQVGKLIIIADAACAATSASLKLGASCRARRPASGAQHRYGDGSQLACRLASGILDACDTALALLVVFCHERHQIE